MGTRVGFSNCSYCGNEARTEKDYCSHIANYKGMKIGFLTNNANHKFGKYAVHEVNHNLEFIELSWVAVPAFADAYVLEKIASKKNGAEGIAGLREAMNNGSLKSQEDYVVSDAEREMAAFASSRSSSVLDTIASAAQCRDTECEFDARKKHNKAGENMAQVRTAGEMARVRIQREEVTYRTLSHDYLAKGSIVVENKSHKWWATSPDKESWHVSIDEGANDFSAAGQQKIVAAIIEMIKGSIDSTDLIVASIRGNVKTGFLQGGDDPLIHGDLEKRVQKGESPYDNKDLALNTGDVREVELENYERTAKEGPAGPLNKPLAKKDETMKHDEENWEKINTAEMKDKFKKAYLRFMISEKQKNMIENLKRALN